MTITTDNLVMGFDAAIALSTGLSASSVSNQISVGLIKSVDNLAKTTAAELFNSLGLGQNVDFSA